MSEPISCLACGRSLSRSPWRADRAATEPAPCGQCAAMDRLNEVARVDAQRHLNTWKGHFLETLTTATAVHTMKTETGIPLRVAKQARLTEIPKTVQKAFPQGTVQSLQDGDFQLSGSKGFGLVGDIAVGKTFTIGALVKRGLWAWMERAPEHWAWSDGRLPNPKECVLWVTWPRAYSWLQAHAKDQDEAAVFKRAMTRCQLLILDDLGREGLTNAAGPGIPYGLRVLDDVISLRYDAELPLLWTSNNFCEFERLYDAAMISRLVDMSPLISVTGPYLRPIE